MAKIYYISAGHAFKAIRKQQCFDQNSNIEIRAAIRVALEYGRKYLVHRTLLHKHKYQGKRTNGSERFIQSEFYTAINGILYKDVYPVSRIDEQGFALCCMSLKFKCHQCHWDKKPRFTGYYTDALFDGKVVCEECKRNDYVVVKHRLRVLDELAKLLRNHKEADHEEHLRVKRYAYRGFNRPESWKDFSSGGSGERLFDEEHNRHIEVGDSGFNYSDEFFRTNLAATKLAFVNRSRVAREFISWK
jgi:hypothetical protein